MIKKSLTAILMLIVSTFAAFAQNGKAEQEILKIHKGLDEAFLKNDVAYFERHFAPDYIYSNNFGKLVSRTENLEYFRTFGTKQNLKVLSNTTDDVKIRVNGKTALVTANWTTTILPNGGSNAEPHSDTGRYTGFYEKRDGKWLVVAEHMSEVNHDLKLMEQQVLKLNREYSEMIQRGDVAAIERTLADDYILTDESGKVFTKTEDLATYKNRQIKIESAETLDQKARLISNNAAIVNAVIKFKGIKNDKPFDITERCTTVWTFRNGRWQIVSDHISFIK